jgi:hypothetical protein
MADIYRVSIVRENSDGAEFESETLFEVAGGLGVVATVAPGALVDALRAANEQAPAALAERVMDSAVPTTHPFQGEPPAKTRRPRRTNAQIAADKLAAEQASAPGAGPTGNGDADLAAAAARSVEVAQPVDVPAEVAPPAPVAAVEPVYNPFLVK